MINTDAQPSEIVEFLQNWFEFPSFEFVQEMVDKLMFLHNNTRLWILKGYMPSEVLEQEKKHLLPLPTQKSKVIEMNSFKKTGRNDLCSCGSGKKFKKCCGK